MATTLQCPIDDCSYTTAEMDVTLAVEVLKIHSLQHTHTAAPTAAATTQSAAKLHKPDRPSVDLGISEAQWDFFSDEWRIFKLRANIDATVAKLELRAACSTHLIILNTIHCHI